jgi:hypothetical protein
VHWAQQRNTNSCKLAKLQLHTGGTEDGSPPAMAEERCKSDTLSIVYLTKANSYLVCRLHLLHTKYNSLALCPRPPCTCATREHEMKMTGMFRAGTMEGCALAACIILPCSNMGAYSMFPHALVSTCIGPSKEI